MSWLVRWPIRPNRSLTWRMPYPGGCEELGDDVVARLVIGVQWNSTEGRQEHGEIEGQRVLLAVEFLVVD